MASDSVNPVVIQRQRKFTAQTRKAIRHLSEVSPELGGWIALAGPCQLRIDWERELYEALVRAVAHQQLHGKAAATILGRLQEGFRGHPFPTPAQLARAKSEKLRGMGFSAAKTLAIQGVARAALAGEIPSRIDAESWTDEELITQLTQLRGIGRWTVEMLLIFTLGRLDVMPVDDFGVQSGLQLLHALPDRPKKLAHFSPLTDHWAPYRSIGAWYLWRRADAAKQKGEG